MVTKIIVFNNSQSWCQETSELFCCTPSVISDNRDCRITRRSETPKYDGYYPKWISKWMVGVLEGHQCLSDGKRYQPAASQCWVCRDDIFRDISAVPVRHVQLGRNLVSENQVRIFKFYWTKYVSTDRVYYYQATTKFNLLQTKAVFCTVSCSAAMWDRLPRWWTGRLSERGWMPLIVSLSLSVL